VNAGDGNNSISVDSVEDVNITTGSGDDDITVVGGNVNLFSEDDNGPFVPPLELNGIAESTGYGSGVRGENGDETLINIDTGTGTDVVRLGNDNADNNQGITALDGSTITGENIILSINSSADLTRASISGVSEVWLTNSDTLDITAEQFASMGGAGAFYVTGASFGASAQLYILVSSDANFSDIIDAANLDRAIDLHFIVADGATLTLTAEELHHYVAEEGIAVADDDADNQVVVTNAGMTFDPFDAMAGTTDIAGGGTLAGSFGDDDVTVIRSFSGFERPEEDGFVDTIVISSDDTPSVGAIAIPNPTAVVMEGSADLEMSTVWVGAGSVIDWSGLTGTLSGLWIENFEAIASLTGNDTTTRVDVQLSAATGDFDANGSSSDGIAGTEDDGIDTSNVEWLIVCDLEDTTVGAIWLSDSSQDLDKIGIHGLAGDTVTFGDVPWGLVSPSVLLEGDGVAGWNETIKAWGNPNYSNIGTVNIDFFADGAPAVVEINNGGTELGASSTGGERWFMVEGIGLHNAHSLTLNITEGDAMIASVTNVADPGVAGTMSDGVEEVTINATEDVSFGAPLPNSVDWLDAGGVAGALVVELDWSAAGPDNGGILTFVGAAGGSSLTLNDVLAITGSSIDGGMAGAAVTVDGVVSLAAATLANVSSVTFTAGAALTVTMDQADAIGASNMSAPTSAGASLNLVGLSDQVFALANYDVDITTIMLTLASDPVVTLHPDTNLTGIAALMVPMGTVLNMTMLQFQQLTGAGTITGPGSVNITDGSAAAAAYDETGDGVSDGLDLSGVSVAGTVTFTESVTLAAGDSLGGFDVVLNDGLTLGGSIDQLDGVDVAGGTDTTIQITNTAMGTGMNDASGWDVDVLRIPEIVAGGTNVDAVFYELTERVLKIIHNGDGAAIRVDQTVNVEPGTSVPGFLEFDKIEDDVELANFILNLEGGTQILGDLDLPSDDETDLIHQHLSTLTINSTGTAENNFTGSTTNVITGNIDPGNLPESLPGSELDAGELLNVTVNAEQAFTLGGEVIFSSVVGDNAFTPDDDNMATGSLTVLGSAAVSLGINTLDTHVIAATVNNAGTGALTVNLASASVDATDTLSFTGGGIVISFAGIRDMRGDDLSGVSAIWMNDDVGGADEIWLTQAQLNGMGTANLVELDTGDDTGAGVGSTLRLYDVDGTFDASAVDSKINIASVNMQADVVLDASANLAGVVDIRVPEGSSITMTAAQYQAWRNAGGDDIEGVDTNGDMMTTPITVNITDLTQADVDNDRDGMVGETMGLPEDFTIANIEAGSIVNIALGESLDLNADDIVTGANITMPDGTTFGIATNVQADGLDITGGAGTIVVFQFDTMGIEVDASNYSFEELRVLSTFIDDTNVEDLIDDLDEAIWLRVYEDPAALGFVSAVNRHVHFDPGVTVPGGLQFNDPDADQEIVTLTLDMEGGVLIQGDIIFDTVDPGMLVATNFQELVINSLGTAMNGLTGEARNQIDGDVDPTNGGDDNNFTRVVINAEQDFLLGDGAGDGQFGFNGLTDMDTTATVVLNGTANVTLAEFDADNGFLEELAIENNLVGGILEVTGGSHSADLVETLTVSGAGNSVWNTDGTGAYISGNETLTLFDASMSTGDNDFGALEEPSETDFMFVAGSGVTMLTIRDSVLDSNPVADPPETGWTFDFTNSAPGSVLTIGDAPAIGVSPGSNIGWVDGDLTIITGTMTADVCIAEDTDWTGISLTFTGNGTIILKEGVDLLLTAAQANGLTIIADPSLDPMMDVMPTVNIVQFDGAVTTGTTTTILDYDFSGISADVAQTITLASDDETASPATVLGAFSVTLESLADGTSLEGQTIRFSTEAQANRTVIVVDNDLTDGTEDDFGDDLGADPSTNVVWLMDSLAAPIDTSNYDANIGRVWFSEALVASEGGDIEGMFTTLPASILRVDFATVDLLDILLSSNPVDRTLEVVAFSTLPNISFSDDGAEPEEHIASLTVNMGGQVTIGSVDLDDIVAAADTDPSTVAFTGPLAFFSYRALDSDDLLAPEGANNNDDGVVTAGETAQPGAVNTVGDVGVGPSNGVDLLNVQSHALEADLNGGRVTFDSEVAMSTALFTSATAMSADAVPAFMTPAPMLTHSNVWVGIDLTDPDIASGTVAHSGPGALVFTGDSPAIDADNTELVTISVTGAGHGDVFLGYDWDATLDMGGDPLGASLNTNAGIAGDTLSDVVVQGDAAADGTVNLGVIAEIDGMDFSLTTSDGEADSDAENLTVTATLGMADVNGVMTAPELLDGGTWVFDADASAGGMEESAISLTITGDVVFGAGFLTLDTGSATVNISGDVDFSTLSQDDPMTAPDETGLAVGMGERFLILDGSSLNVNVDQMNILNAAAAEVDALETDAMEGILGDGALTVTGSGDLTTAGIAAGPVDFSPATSGDPDTQAARVQLIMDGDTTINETQLGELTAVDGDLNRIDLIDDGAHTLTLAPADGAMIQDADTTDVDVITPVNAGSVKLNIAQTALLAPEVADDPMTAEDEEYVYTYDLVDTFANIIDPLNEPIVLGADTYTISDIDDLTPGDVAGLTAEQAAILLGAVGGVGNFPTSPGGADIDDITVTDTLAGWLALVADADSGTDAGAVAAVTSAINAAGFTFTISDLDTADLDDRPVTMGALILAAENYVDAAMHPFSVEDNAENIFNPGMTTPLNEYGAVTLTVLGTATGAIIDDMSIAQQIVAAGASTLNAYSLVDSFANYDGEGDDDLSTDDEPIRDGATTYEITDLGESNDPMIGDDTTDFTAAPLSPADAVILGNAANIANLDTDNLYDVSGTVSDSFDGFGDFYPGVEDALNAAVDVTFTDAAALLEASDIINLTNSGVLTYSVIDDVAAIAGFLIADGTVLEGASAITHVGVGGAASGTGTTGVADAFEFNAAPGTTTAITNFDGGVGGDTLDFTGIATWLTGAPVSVVANFNPDAGQVYFISVAAGDADTPAASAAAINATGATVTDDMDGITAYFVVVDDNSTSVYEYVDNGMNDMGINSTELSLIATVDSQVGTGDLLTV
jgi:hypothetical protein